MKSTLDFWEPPSCFETTWTILDQDDHHKKATAVI